MVVTSTSDVPDSKYQLLSNVLARVSKTCETVAKEFKAIQDLG